MGKKLFEIDTEDKEKSKSLISTSTVVLNYEKLNSMPDRFKYKDIETVQSDSYYSLAEKTVDDLAIKFVYAGVKKYIEEMVDSNLNVNDDDMIEFYEEFLTKANEFYEEFLFNLNMFKSLNMMDKVEIIYLFLKNDLPDWIYEETEYIDGRYSDDEDNGSDEPYDVSKIDIINKQFEVASLYRKYKEENELDLSPDYQRNFVWTSRQKSKLIESLLIGIPLPTFYIDARDENKWIIIDGVQRLTTILTFMDNTFKLNNMQYLKYLDGKKFDALDRKYRRRIEDFQLLCNMVRPNTPSKIAFNIFQRINTLGTHLEVQELRNAMYRGKSTELLKKLSKSDEFVNVITEKKVNSYEKRKEDHAIILRYLAFQMTNYLEYTKNDMNAFLEKAMDTVNKMNDLEIKSLENTFLECMKKAKIIFENDAFCKPSKGKIGNPISKALFESIGYALDLYTIEEIEKNKIKLREKINETYKKDEFILMTSVATNNPPKVHYRFNLFLELFKEVIGH